MSYNSVFKQDLFAGKTIIVTGGGSGIGRCCAHELCHLGAHVVLIGRTLKKLETVKAEIIEDGGKADFFTCDIREEELVKDTVSAIIEKHDVIHGLFNNAGGQYPAPLSAINQKGFETVVRSNLVGGFLLAREVYTQCMIKTGGSIVNMIAEMWGGMPGMGHSGAARAGMENFTKTASFEWGESGVRVNAIAPGHIMTSGMDTYDSAIRDIFPILKEGVPLKRMGTESEISGAVIFLLSEAAAYISGATLRIDGAMSQGNRLWPLPEARNNEAYNGFHRTIIPDIF
jgi:citronellol/citronellal dehydrogenase